jgi:serine/threonine protein phosphatase PrpC
VISHLLIDERCESPLELRTDAVEVCGLTRPSPDHPDRNDDAAAVWLRSDGSALLAVADGMGGTPQGAEAAARAIHALDAGIRQAASGDEVRGVVLDAFEQANREILEQLAGSGTTLVVGELVGGEIRSYNVGDSSALLIGQRGRVKLETIAHSPVGYGVAAGLIDPDAAMEHEDRHFLSNHLGSRSMHVELGSSRSFALRDTLLLASDGLMDNITLTELVEIVRCGPLGDAATRLIELCEERMNGRNGQGPGKLDDVTFLLLRNFRP